MFLIDSNIIVYSHAQQYNYLRDIYTQNSIFVSEITRVEVLGYHKLTCDEEFYFKEIFDLVPAIFPTQQIFDTAIEFRKSYHLKLGDSIIAATAMVNNLIIYTRNLKDFERISNLHCINPLL